jgi:radical SAM protein with 4Fe4S-binding SPASM domain
MSTETYEKMLYTTEKLFERGVYFNSSFKLSGGEPFLVWKSFALPTANFIQRNKDRVVFHILSNLTVLDDRMVDWLAKNQIRIQVSLDDLDQSKPLKNNQNSPETVLKNIQKLQQAKIRFSINTVLNLETTEIIKDLAEYVCLLKTPQKNNIDWGLTISYAENDNAKIAVAVKILKDAITILKKNNYDISRKLRIQNIRLSDVNCNCHAGTPLSFAIGTNLEVYSCQSMIDKKPLGYFDENIKHLLESSVDNRYFYNRTLLPQCTDCTVLQWCRGGCRAINLKDRKATEVTCRIKQEIVDVILQGRNKFLNGGI